MINSVYFEQNQEDDSGGDEGDNIDGASSGQITVLPAVLAGWRAQLLFREMHWLTARKFCFGEEDTNGFLVKYKRLVKQHLTTAGILKQVSCIRISSTKLDESFGDIQYVLRFEVQIVVTFHVGNEIRWDIQHSHT